MTSTMKMTAHIMTAAKVGFGMYEKYGVSNVNAKITNVAEKESYLLLHFILPYQMFDNFISIHHKL